MIDFTTKQLSWTVITALGIGGGGYVTLTQKVEDIDKKIAILNNTVQYNQKLMDKIEVAIARIEDKFDRKYNRDK